MIVEEEKKQKWNQWEADLVYIFFSDVEIDNVPLRISKRQAFPI